MSRADNISIEDDALYSPADAAVICRVAPRTVNKWFDSGRLGGYTLPDSYTRRIPQKALKRFLKSHGMFEEWERFEALKLEAEGEGEDTQKIGFQSPVKEPVEETPVGE
jgi:hypothetical protein